MELAISAVASDLVSRFISSIINKFSSCSCLEEKVERLRHLLLRVQTVVEEADARCITNSGMLLQLKVLGDAMYRGYYVLDTFKYRRLREDVEDEVSDGSSALFFATPLKRFHRSAGTRNHYNLANNELKSALGSLEAAVTNMTEFVILLGGCERMPRRPYDTYLYMENFMFGRHAEKQQAINILLDNNPLNNAPTILPIIGGRLVGKKTLVAHVCNDERVRSHFSSILNLNGNNFQKIDQETYLSGRCLVIVEFVSDVRDEDWTKFYSLLACIGNGSKVIVISRLQKFARFGTVKPICLNNFSFEEYSYLFKVLSFGSTSMDDYPHLASMVQVFAMLMRGSLLSACAFADVLRKNMNTEFWLCILTRWTGPALGRGGRGSRPRPSTLMGPSPSIYTVRQYTVLSRVEKKRRDFSASRKSTRAAASHQPASRFLRFCCSAQGPRATGRGSESPPAGRARDTSTVRGSAGADLRA